MLDDRDTSDPAMQKAIDQLGDQLGDWWWRMTSGAIYKIKAKSESDDPDDADAPGMEVPFRPNASQLALIHNLHIRNIVLKARQMGFCAHPDTRVLTADLRWVRIDDVQPGDELVAVDENVPGGKGRSRKMRTTRVVARADRHAPAYRITLDDGRTVICTGNHRWLTRPPGDKRSTLVNWRAIEGDGKFRIKLGTQIRWITEPWDEPTYEDGWMGGMLDGEGSISKSNVAAGINVSQRPGHVWDRLVSYASERGYNACIESDGAERPSKHGKTPVPQLAFGRMDEIFRLIGQTRPSRFIGNRFWEGRDLPGKRSGTGWATVTGIEALPEQRCVDLQTEHGTFIAEGLVSHNSTLIEVMALDHALWNADQSVTVIAHTRGDAEKLFRNKVCYAYDRLPQALKDAMPLRKRTESQLIFDHNGSSIEVVVSARSDTVQFLHVSEMGKIAANFPNKARELTTGSLQAVPKDGLCFIESTSEGTDGAFYELARRAQKQKQQGTFLTAGDYRFHFFGWWMDPGYRMDPRGVVISMADHEYFDTIEGEMDIAIDMEQRAWYVNKRDSDFAHEPTLMWREYPSTPDECWKSSTEGKYLHKVLAAARKDGRIGKFPHRPELPVNGFWDLGSSDTVTLWLHQHYHGRDFWLNYREEAGAGYLPFLLWFESLGYLPGTMFLPHDAEHKITINHGKKTEKVTSAVSQLREARPNWEWQVVPVVSNIQHGIDLLRKAFAGYFFDEEGCKEGLAHLGNYKRQFITRLQTWGNQPEHDDASHATDAIRQHAQAFDPSATMPKRNRHVRRPSGLTV